MMTTTTARQPKGQPTGGEFAERSYADADIHLGMSDLDYNMTGTFLFPPRPRNAEQHIAFWESCDVDDSVLENICLGYEKWAFNWHDEQQRQWLFDTWYPENGIDPHKGQGNNISKAQIEAREAAADEYSDTVLTAVHPRKIVATDARQIARAGQMYYYSGDLNAADCETVEQRQVPLRDETLTVKEIVTKYNLSGIRDFFAGSTRAIVESLDQIRVEAADRD